MARAVWKGAVTFGLVNVPVALYPASQSDDVDFDWLDKRTMDPVGYKRINKRTGKDIDKDNIVKGVKTESGDYVVLSEEEVAEAYPKTLQSIEIQAFVKATDVSFVYMERPYFLEASGRGADKVYALLRDAMVKQGVIGIARLVMHTKEHLAALIPAGPALMIDLLRWADEIRSPEGLNLPGKDVSSRIKAAEMTMATKLVDEMTTHWKPADYDDTFREAIMALVKRKAAAGKTFEVTPLEDAPAAGASNVVDLTALLKNSLGRGGAAGKAAAAGKSAAAGRSSPADKAESADQAAPAKKPTAKQATAKKPAAKKTVAKKPAARKAA